MDEVVDSFVFVYPIKLGHGGKIKCPR